MNFLLLCHGRLSEFGSFELADNQELQYRGNFGTPLSSSNAKGLVQALLQNPTVTDTQIARQLTGYMPQAPLAGPASSRPDIKLSGDDKLLCFGMNMATRRWIPLPGGWSSSLNTLLPRLGAPLWLNLLSCTTLGDGNVQQAFVDPNLTVPKWADLLP